MCDCDQSSPVSGSINTAQFMSLLIIISNAMVLWLELWTLNWILPWETKMVFDGIGPPGSNASFAFFLQKDSFLCSNANNVD